MVCIKAKNWKELKNKNFSSLPDSEYNFLFFDKFFQQSYSKIVLRSLKLFKIS
jgi:hypothetical protein